MIAGQGLSGGKLTKAQKDAIIRARVNKILAVLDKSQYSSIKAAVMSEVFAPPPPTNQQEYAKRREKAINKQYNKPENVNFQLDVLVAMNS